MKRLDFLKEMKNGFTATVKGATAPIVEEKTEQFEDAVRILSGERWVEVSLPSTVSSFEVKDIYLSASPIFLVQLDGCWKVYKKLCSHCGGILHISVHDHACSCFQCDLTISLLTDVGSLKLTQLELRERQEKYFVGLPK